MHNNRILSEVILAPASSDADADANSSKNKYSHMLYEFQRCSSVLDLTNSISHIVQVAKKDI